MNTKVEKIKFPEPMKAKINAYIKRKNLDITFIDGGIIRFENSNTDVIEPHKIIMETDDIQLLFLYYGNFSENKNKFYLYNLENPISWTSMQQLVKEVA